MPHFNVFGKKHHQTNVCFLSNQIEFKDQEHECHHCKKRLKTAAGLKRLTRTMHWQDNDAFEDCSKRVDVYCSLRHVLTLPINNAIRMKSTHLLQNTKNVEVLKFDGCLSHTFYTSIQKLLKRLINKINKEQRSILQ